MSRAERLLHLMQVLRRHRRPVEGARLAELLGISLRTVYRDIASLQAQGVGIEGAAGVGFVLRHDNVLPPLMFTEEEVQALVLGSRWVAQRGDPRLVMAAQNAIAKIGAVMRPELRLALETSPLLVVQTEASQADNQVVADLRQAIQGERKVLAQYQDARGQTSERTLWPFAIGFFERVRVVVAWCELRSDVRHFRTDRFTELTVLEARYPQRRHALMKRWRAQDRMAPP